MPNNPFSLTFGKKPESLIDMIGTSDEIIENFESENPPNQVYMITGVRGSGKTVLLTTVANTFREEKDWVVVDLIPERDLLQALAAELSAKAELARIFKEAKLSISFLGVNLAIDGVAPITDVVVALDRMLEKLTNRGKKVLITIDEAISNDYIKIFASQFQVFLRKNYNVFLIMAGLHENIRPLQDTDSLTFLYRAPRIETKPLNLTLISNKYQSIFNLSENTATEMAKETKGYPYAFQVLGYLCYKHKEQFQNVINEYYIYLVDYVYKKMWDELSKKDKSVLIAMSKTESEKVEEIRKTAKMNSNQFNEYRKRLLDKGVIASKGHGYLEFTLPRFKEFVTESI